MALDLAAMLADDMDDFDNIDTAATLLQKDADSGVTLATCENVTALPRLTDDAIQMVGEGEVPKRTGRIHLKASTCDFVPKRHDVIVLSNGGKWLIESVAWATLNTRYACEVVYIV